MFVFSGDVYVTIQITFLTGGHLRTRDVICIVTYKSPLKTNTHYRRLGLYTRSGLCDRSDPDVAIKAYGIRTSVFSIDTPTLYCLKTIGTHCHHSTTLGGCPFHGRVERDEIPTRESPPKQSGTLPSPPVPSTPSPLPACCCASQCTPCVRLAS